MKQEISIKNGSGVCWPWRKCAVHQRIKRAAASRLGGQRSVCGVLVNGKVLLMSSGWYGCIQWRPDEC